MIEREMKKRGKPKIKKERKEIERKYQRIK